MSCLLYPGLYHSPSHGEKEIVVRLVVMGKIECALEFEHLAGLVDIKNYQTYIIHLRDGNKIPGVVDRS